MEGKILKKYTYVRELDKRDKMLYNTSSRTKCVFGRQKTVWTRVFASVEGLRECPDICEFYEDIAHRERRRKTAIKAQKSEASLVNRLKGMHDEAHDKRALVLAYGAWGLQAECACQSRYATRHWGRPHEEAGASLCGGAHSGALYLQDLRQVFGSMWPTPDATDKRQQRDQGTTRVPTRGL